eukprot:CAMPEP_0115858724 /NCGR_PEP_ID=MMETSP0287-20121206/16246_1 /TAXON_ID=412157 /ORGANISM="Chrysochromulina rotalis, Strain UIO044" /LENGTH=55 /DNA_ID=CAMNT_0003312999 /DNA_START=30 /DNA_END=197 /DNA_ORIENTATION=+
MPLHGPRTTILHRVGADGDARAGATGVNRTSQGAKRSARDRQSAWSTSGRRDDNA